jgi:type IX secretion system PorP/SprF family membrane protein
MKTINQLITNKLKQCASIASGLIVAAIILAAPAKVYAQADIHFSQFYETSILRNPAMTGVFSDDYKVGLYYRNQWSSITNPYRTTMISAESHFSVSHTSDDFVSFGVLGYSDRAGSVDQRITTFYPAINYNKSINPNHNTYLSVGFTGGYVQYSFDPTKSTFNNQYQNGKYNSANPTLENIPSAKMDMWDLGVGLNLNTSTGEDNNTTYIIGLSGYHFTKPKLSYYGREGVTQNIRWNMNGTINRYFNEEVTMQVQANLALQGAYKEIMAGFMVNYTKRLQDASAVFVMSGGLFYRYGDAVIPVVKVKYNAMALAISYDVNVSTLKQASNLQGGYELTLFYTGNFTDKGPARKTVCPKY